jgi:hypothetical protein
MPRIGTGQAGGSWDVIRDLIGSAFGPTGIAVTVYDLPGNRGARKSTQQSLGLTTEQA